MSVFTYRSTMLVENVVHVIDRDDVDDDEFNDFCSNCAAALEEHGNLAEFRLTAKGLESDEQWLFDRLNRNTAWSGPEVMKLINAAISGCWDDESMVMAAFYIDCYSDDADRVITAVQAQEFLINYNSDEKQAYIDYAKKKLEDNDEGLGDDLENYFNFEQYGRDKCDDCIQFSDGDFYVFNEWH